jgi:D-arabinose 1-dehydrogenase-like Zn-dependent alcohol dehydrogenase
LNKLTGTYQSSNKHGRAAVAGPTKLTLGGYTSKMIVHYKFAIRIPKSYPLEMAGPIMCAGVTMYSPLINNGVKEGTEVCIVALGGLGQMGVRIAKALKAKVTVISSSASKKELAIKTGADEYIVSTEKEQMDSSSKKFDIILNTIPSYHDYLMYQPLLKDTGVQVLLGLHAGFAASMILTKLRGGKSRIKSSSIGSIKETQAVIDLVDKHKIYPDIKVVPCSQLNQVYTDLDSNNATGSRYVLDIANTLVENVTCGIAPTIKPDNQHMSICTIVTELLGLIFCCRCL